MSVVMKGMDVANAMKEQMIKDTEELKSKGVIPCLAIVRVGARPDDLAYERGAKKRTEGIGIECRVIELPEDITRDAFEAEFKRVNEDQTVHGILLLRPLPAQLDEAAVADMIDPVKDVDGMSKVNIAKVFCGDESGHAPCTAEGVMDMLEYNNIDLTGKRVTILGRSMVVGKPLAMMMLKKNATVTICHTKTLALAETCADAEVLIVAAGKAKVVTEDMVGEGAVVVDVGINVDEDGNLCGDVDYESVEDKASYISPVPRGVGSVTSSVLAKHVIKATKKLAMLF